MSTPEDAQPAKDDKNNVKPSSDLDQLTVSADQTKLSALEKKRQKQAEKAARRAQVVAKKEEICATSTPAAILPKVNKDTTTTAKTEKAEAKEAFPNTKNSPTQDITQVAESEETAYPYKNPLVLFRHLPQRKELSTMSVADMENIHQDVQILGLDMVNYRVVGSHDRLVTMLTVFKKVIQDYEAPKNQALIRHFGPNVLDPQIIHLNDCRPLSVSQGTAIRWLKQQINSIDAEMSEEKVKAELCRLIDEFIRDKSTFAHQLITEKGVEKICNGDVVLTYGRSVVVAKTIKKAWKDGKRFSLVVIDNDKPLREGLRLCELLRDDKDLEGLKIDFGAFTSLDRLFAKVDKVVLGAHAIMADGSLYNRSGAAAVCLQAHLAVVPVIVLCESVKFSGESPTSSLDFNEIAPGNHLIPAYGEEYGSSAQEWFDLVPLEKLKHRYMRGVNALQSKESFMYDLTPPQWLSIVVSEHGAVPPTSVPILNRLYNEANDA